MSVVSLRIGGRDYQVACDNGQEDHLRLLADDIDDRVRSLVFQMGSNPGEAMSLLMAALTMADELTENKREIEILRSQIGQGAAHDPDRLMEMEAAMAGTIEEIALRIEKIADQVEMR